MRIIGIVGCRARNGPKDYEAVERAFDAVYEEGDGVCSGGCPRGADRFARLLARKRGAGFIEFPALWQVYGRKAGFIRNTEIAKHSDVLIACVSPERRGGTEDTIKKFRAFHPEGEVHEV